MTIINNAGSQGFRPLVACWIISALLMGMGLRAQDMSVYLSTTSSAKEREKVLKNDPALAGVNITVFGKHKEFISAYKVAKPAIVIAPASFLLKNQDYKAVYQLKNNGQSSFRFLLLSVNERAIDEKKAVGVVDELGRRGMKSFVRNTITNFKKVKRVTKPDDLMPLLVLGNADYILVRPKNYELLKKKYTTKTIQVSESKSVKFARIFVLKHFSEEAITKLGGLSLGTLKVLGFSEISKLEGGQ